MFLRLTSRCNQFFLFHTRNLSSIQILGQFYSLVPIHGDLTYESLSQIWQLSNPLAIYTYKISPVTRNVLCKLYMIRKRWIDLSDLPSKLDVDHNIFSATLGHRCDPDNPVFSVITPAYHSGNRILRPLRSLQKSDFSRLGMDHLG